MWISILAGIVLISLFMVLCHFLSKPLSFLSPNEFQKRQSSKCRPNICRAPGVWKVKIYKKYDWLPSWFGRLDLDEKVKEELLNGVYFNSYHDARDYTDSLMGVVAQSLKNQLEHSSASGREYKYVRTLKSDLDEKFNDRWNPDGEFKNITYWLKPIDNTNTSRAEIFCIIKKLNLK